MGRDLGHGQKTANPRKNGMTPSSEALDVVVVGAGISGLATAYYLQEMSHGTLRLAVLEGADRIGGLIRTETFHDCRLDFGPESFRTGDEDLSNLCRDLNLEKDFLAPTPHTDAFMVESGGKFHALPAALALGIPADLRSVLCIGTLALLPWPARLAMLRDLTMRPTRKHSAVEIQADESVGRFFDRHFGPQVVNRLIEPVLGAIYSRKLRDLSLAATLPQLSEIERASGSLIRGLRSAKKKQSRTVQSFRDGMSTLTQQLAQRIADIRLNHRVQAIRPTADGFAVTTNPGHTFRARAVVVTTPVEFAKPLLSFDPDLRAAMHSMKASSTVVLYMGLRKGALPRKARTAGIFYPFTGDSLLRTCACVSEKFPDRSAPYLDLFRFTFHGLPEGHIKEAVTHDLELEARMRLRAILGRPFEVVFNRVQVWDRRIPQYRVGHMRAVARLDKALKCFPGLYVTGAGVRGPGIPRCVAVARRNAEAISGALGRAPRVEQP